MVIPLVFARSVQKGCPWLRVRETGSIKGARMGTVRLMAWCLFDFPGEYFVKTNAAEILGSVPLISRMATQGGSLKG